MANIGNILLEKEILLESGTNEVEVLVFRVGDHRLGVNVAKVREVLSSQKITQIPQAHSSVLGCFRLRDVVVPCVSLHRHLKHEEAPREECKVILTEFNGFQTAFMVDQVERIHRISWEQILPVPDVVTRVACPVTAVTNLEGNLVMLLDFETIAAEISNQSQNITGVANPNQVPRESAVVLIADDSATVRVAVETTLRTSGYTNVRAFENGQQAWNYIQQRFQETGDVWQVADVLVSDVEMPAMDGFHLTRNIKEHPDLRQLPVVLFSSILTPENKRKGTTVGADAQITKPELARVVELADEMYLRHKDAKPAAVAAGA